MLVFLRLLSAALLTTLLLPNVFAVPSSYRKCRPRPKPGNDNPQPVMSDVPPAGTGVVSTKGPSPVTTTVTQPPQATPPSGSNDSPVSDSDIKEYLNAHNSFRALHNAGPLTWDNELALKAQEWANRCVMEHSGGDFGENLAAGTGDYSIRDAVNAWTSESTKYKSKKPTASHFTQVVWKGSKRLGCASKICSGIFPQKANFIVCEYDPAGNVIGDFKKNVFR